MAGLPWPNTYEYIVTQQNNIDPTIEFRNTVSFFSPTVPTPSDGIIVALNAYFNSMVHSDVNTIQCAVYKWVRGGPSPYPTGLPIFVLPINVAGVADAAWGYSGSEKGVGGEVCLRIKKTNTGGLKPGRLYLRGLLRENDVIAESGGRWVFQSGTPITSAKHALIVQSTGLLNYLGTHLLNPEYLFDVAYSKKHTTVGPGEMVFDLTMEGPTTNKISRKSRR